MVKRILPRLFVLRVRSEFPIVAVSRGDILYSVRKVFRAARRRLLVSSA